MLELRYENGLGQRDILSLRQSVQGEAQRGGLSPQHGFMLLFVVDELVCNVMEHARAGFTELAIEASSSGFRLTLTDDGLPFDPAGQAKVPVDTALVADRRLGLHLVGRLVDEMDYQRTPEGLNRVELAKSF
ncbi:MAG TPA: ATP-binding protein [bacterium]|jgi:anti-sigma regulatory factor (Ser/Thr protein kinase)|nr:ATP-binding protein [bacterium]